MCSIDMDDWDEAFNFATSEEFLPYNYIRLEMMPEHCSDVKVVIVGLSYHSFAFAHDFFPDEAYPFCYRAYPIIKNIPVQWHHPIYRAWMEAKLNHSFGIVTKNAIPGIKRTVLDHVPLVHAVLLAPDEHSIVAPVPIEWESRINTLYGLKSPSSLSITSLHQIKDLCLQKGYKLILYNAPLAKVHFDHTPPEYIHLTDSVAHALADNQNVYYLNYSQYPLPDSCFSDGDHTNIYGARIITPLLRDSLAALGVIPTTTESNK
jgi:hypothetical protein